jgi:hypothetical protein
VTIKPLSPAAVVSLAGYRGLLRKRQNPLPPELRDGQYRSWEVEMATRFPLALSEMRWPSAGSIPTQP